ncbi:MAG: hypothetical protein NC410_02280 [Oscillibacter sp.]|nr:hypothetical protein [Oscillibacter sp.]
MKKIYVLFIALSALLLTGCENDPIIYNGPDFVSFSEKTISKVVRSEADGMVTIEVGCANKSNEARTFTVSVDAANTTAVEGTDFDFVSKSVTIPAGEYAGKIQIKGNYDNLTPEGVTLTLNLDVDASMIQEGTTHSVKITMSRFFEVNMEWLCGVWDWTDYDLSSGEEDDSYQVEITEVDENTVSIYNIWGGGRSVTATVDWENGVISILPDQVIYVHSSYGNVYMDWTNGASFSRTAPISASCTFRGIETIGWGAFANDYSVGAAFGFYFSSLTKAE